MQDALLALTKYWTDRGCMIAQPYNTEVGAGTANPATFLRVLGPEPWHVAYVEPSVRPDDARYGENPNRLQMHSQFQVILKPEPGDPQELYLGSLQALGIDTTAHDIRFVEDNWAQPTIGAWGLGWEVWLDGLEITQFTYFQQVGGQALDPVPVELTYGVERILMALQGVSHFKDIIYAPGVTYGEVFGQSEYEMSRYYLDDADVDTNRTLYETYVQEAERLVAARLPVPAYSYVLKCSHAFNVLDARGAISTTERAKAFARMRGLAREVATLWIERRAELGHPLGIGRAAHENEPLLTPAVAGSAAADELPPAPLVIEIGTEELPPHEVTNTVAAVEAAVRERLAATRLAHGAVHAYGTPRRVVVTVDEVGAREPDAERTVRGPRVSAAYDAEGAPTKALAGFLRGQGISDDDENAAATAVSTAEFGGNEHVVVTVTDQGRSAEQVLSGLVADVVSGLRAEKNMRWSDGALSFSRPIRWLLVLLGDSVVPVAVSSLTSDRKTRVHRTAEQPEVSVATAAGYVELLRSHGIEADGALRRQSIVAAVEGLATSVGGMVDVDAESSLVDEITNLVEQPTAILGNFDNRYLELPEQVLTTVMRKHQRYLPVRSRDGRLLPHFVTVANGACDEALVRAGNEAVLRARYEDAAFFWRADLGVPLDEFSAGLTKLTFEERLGSMADRTARIAFIAAELQPAVGLDRDDEKVLARAAALAKFDLASHMVVELSSLAGVMAREYAVRAGEPAAVAQALFEMELPRHTSDQLPTALPGAVLALADRFDLLMAMFALGAKPTGSSDPFGLRRAALGVVRILREFPALSSITVSLGLSAAADQLRVQGVPVATEAVSAAEEFVSGRFAQQLRDEDVPAAWVEAVLPAATAPGRAVTTLSELRGRAADPEFRRLVAALQRISRILPADVEGVVDRAHLHESAEKRLADTVEDLADFAKGSVGEFAVEAAPLVEPVDAFFTEILVMAEDPALRRARLGLLATILQRSPKSVDWQALDTALG